MKFTKKHYRSQVDSRDCGVAVIAMILEYYGSHYSLSTLRELTKTSDEGTTALAIVKLYQNYTLKFFYKGKYKFI
ncbi:hypothetical protein CSW65_00015 [Streptococcus agalactiae]|nr:hypothetical protein CSW65_00015 [Streptococcus agalactiae]